jgi:hypothetical protein
MKFSTGARKAIVKKGSKYPEQVCDHTKSSISCMMCGPAKGEFLPPYVVYKGKNVYDSWCTGGPKGTVYTSSPTGWFDMFIFEDWFFKIFLPAARRLTGKKVLIGDNLASHISAKVIQCCRENNIEFVCLPPNATDKMQPLDVGIFGPMKSAWRAQLSKYADKDPAAKLLLKTEFPKMLKELLLSLNPKQHLPAAFEKCGLVPLNRNKVLERIPSVKDTHTIARNLDASLLKKLEVRRFGDQSRKKPRGKKVPAGQSYSREEAKSSGEEDSEGEDSVGEDNVGEDSVGEDSEQENSEQENSKQGDSEQEDSEQENSEQENSEQVDDTIQELGDEELPEPGRTGLRAGASVVAVYEGQWFLAEVTGDQVGVAVGYTNLSYMTIKGSNSFIWGSKPDIMLTLNEDIILEDIEMIPINNRGHFGLKKEDLKRVTTWMVVVYLPFFHSKFFLSFLNLQKHFCLIFILLQ